MPRRRGRAGDQPRRVQRRASSKCGVVAVGAGTQSPVIGAGGEGDGFRRIARRAAIMADGVPIGGGEVPIMAAGMDTVGGEAPTVLTATGARSHIPIENGEAPPGVGVIRSRLFSALRVSGKPGLSP